MSPATIFREQDVKLIQHVVNSPGKTRPVIRRQNIGIGVSSDHCLSKIFTTAAGKVINGTYSSFAYAFTPNLE